MSKAFSESLDSTCLTCNHVIDNKCEILYVSHYLEDGVWQFLCGADMHDELNGREIDLESILKLDPNIAGISDLPPGYSAERKNKQTEWKIYKDE